ncbi:MAG: hypothetical protein JWQ76_2651 [Ramlibacter sp.]|nr:hypothetical protein [Ramlibacter sp.]
MTRQRLAWGCAGMLLAALALGACSKPQGEPAVQDVPATAGGATSGAQPSGIGLKSGLGTGMTGSFPSTSTATRATTGTMGNSGDSTTGSGGAAIQRP